MNILKSKSSCNDLIDKSKKAGDRLLQEHENTKDINTVQVAISAYNTAVNAARVQLIYKKLTGKPKSMEFFE